MENIIVNAVGEPCPIPVVKATKALRAMTQPGTLEVRVDNQVAVENLKRMAAGNHLPVRVDGFTVFMDVQDPKGDVPAEEPELTCTPAADGSLLVAVDTDVMGRGSDELGKTLMKGFLFALTQQDVLPTTVLFYNGGATLTVEGSASLEDLKNLAAQGVEILTCGTCLNYYNLTDKLAVGEVTNMYSIVEKLTQADLVVKP